MEQQTEKPRRLIYAVKQAEIDKEINRLKRKSESLRAKRRRPVIAGIIRAMFEFDIEPQEVIDAYQSGRDGNGTSNNSRPETVKLPVKYRHPETGAAWSGRGKTPRWLREEEAAGAQREAFRVA
jgi:DNA-binding protein H-NS